MQAHIHSGASMAIIKYVSSGNVATLTFSNPPQNRITDAWCLEFDAALLLATSDGSRALLIQADDQDFSRGGEIESWPLRSSSDIRAMLSSRLSLFNRFEALPIPTIAAVQGACLGGGFELVLRADIVFAAQTATFGHPEHSIALTTVLGGVYRVAERAGRNRAMQWALSGEALSAELLHSLGLVNFITDLESLREQAATYAAKLAKGPTRAYAVNKALLHLWSEAGPAAADSALLEIAGPLLDTHDARIALRGAVKALQKGEPRPSFEFNGQ